MRRYTISVNETSYELDVEEINADTFHIKLDGRSIRVRVDDDQDLAQALITPELEVASTRSASEGEEARSAGATTAPAPIRARRPRRAGALTAPMPGVVLNVQVSAGQQVTQGDPVLILEAMKMENTLRAPTDGRVAEVMVHAGDQVKYGDPLVRFGEV